MSTPARRVVGALVTAAAALSVSALAAPAHAATAGTAAPAKVPSKVSDSLKVGQKFVLTLPVCTDCGDTWKIVSATNHKVTIGALVTHGPKLAPGEVGGEATQVVTFKGAYTGVDKVVLKEYGPGRGTPALKTLTLTFTVTKA